MQTLRTAAVGRNAPAGGKAMIDSYTFGRMVIDGRVYQADLTIVSGQVQAGWWRREGHLVEVEDVTDILAARPEILVVGTGSPGQMRVSDTLARTLRDLAIELVEQPTPAATATYNQLAAEGRNTAAAFHLTC